MAIRTVAVKNPSELDDLLAAYLSKRAMYDSLEKDLEGIKAKLKEDYGTEYSNGTFLIQSSDGKIEALFEPISFSSFKSAAFRKDHPNLANQYTSSSTQKKLTIRAVKKDTE